MPTLRHAAPLARVGFPPADSRRHARSRGSEAIAETGKCFLRFVGLSGAAQPVAWARHPPSSIGMSAQTDKVVHWLLSSLEPRSQLFHVGQYCGDWQASTAGRAKASFHVILHGSAWLHFADGRDSIPVTAGEAVFLLRDVPHGLSPSPVNPQACAVAGGRPLERRGSMQPL
ncbi:cupin domain-containing protein, partial [Burkholderia cenocepacia]|uniref:cupin domain-containing protein n=1 Tax=Burkholderia cenocepacia TaxID=95486 RepID=UPI001EFB66B3